MEQNIENKKNFTDKLNFFWRENKLKLLIGASSSKIFHLREFAKKLEEYGVEVKIVLDIDYADGFPNRRISKWFSSNKKFKKPSLPTSFIISSGSFPSSRIEK